MNNSTLTSPIFNFGEQQHTVRIFGTPGDPWFCAADIGDVLGLGNVRTVLGNLRENQRGVTLTDTPGGPQTINIINESGLYRIIFASRKKEAEAFQDWVTGEVLPALRRTGTYSTATPDGTESSSILRLIEQQNGLLTQFLTVSQQQTTILTHLVTLIQHPGILIQPSPPASTPTRSNLQHARIPTAEDTLLATYTQHHAHSHGQSCVPLSTILLLADQHQLLQDLIPTHLPPRGRLTRLGYHLRHTWPGTLIPGTTYSLHPTNDRHATWHILYHS